VIDREGLELMSKSDILLIKLAAAYYAKFVHALRQLDPVPLSARIPVVPVSSPATPSTPAPIASASTSGPVSP
jgi:hypothetical protein